jgi:RHS repeat-associated protein
MVSRTKGTNTTRFVYRSGLQLAAELDTNNNVTTQYVYASGRNIPDYAIRGGVNYRLVTDYLGSLRAVVNTSTGQIVQKTEYDPWGVPTDASISGVTWAPLPFGFAGGIRDRDTGLVRFGTRDYDPSTGRWTAKDPIRFAGGQANLYQYAGDDPLNRADPNGDYADAPVIIGSWIGLAGVEAFAAVALPAVVIAGAAYGAYELGTMAIDATFAYIAARQSEAVARETADWFAKKRDIQQIEEIIKRVGLDRAQRRQLHDQITRQGLDLGEIEEMAKEIKGETEPNVCEDE